MEHLTQIYKALSEEMRLRIVMLLTHGEICVCDFMEVFGENQSKISRHLSYLKHSGLVKSRRVGTWMHYSLSEPINEMAAAQIDLLKQRYSHHPMFLEDEGRMRDLIKFTPCTDDKSESNMRHKKDNMKRKVTK